MARLWTRIPARQGTCVGSPRTLAVERRNVTCAAQGPAGEIHERTPVILPRDRVDGWLDPTRTDPDAIGEVLAGIRPPLLGIRAVSREMNRVGTNGPQLVEPLADSRTPTSSSSWFPDAGYAPGKIARTMEL